MKEKQVEEMAKDVWKASCAGNDLKCNTCEHSGLLNNEYSCLDFVMAEGLYNAGYRKQEWISVEERLPEESGAYLAHTALRNISVLDYSARHELFYSFDSYSTDMAESFAIGVTHWMPLPEPPKMKGGAE